MNKSHFSWMLVKWIWWRVFQVDTQPKRVSPQWRRVKRAWADEIFKTPIQVIKVNICEFDIQRHLWWCFRNQIEICEGRVIDYSKLEYGRSDLISKLTPYSSSYLEILKNTKYKYRSTNCLQIHPKQFNFKQSMRNQSIWNVITRFHRAMIGIFLSFFAFI